MRPKRCPQIFPASAILWFLTFPLSNPKTQVKPLPSRGLKSRGYLKVFRQGAKQNREVPD